MELKASDWFKGTNVATVTSPITTAAVWPLRVHLTRSRGVEGTMAGGLLSDWTSDVQQMRERKRNLVWENSIKSL